MYVVSTLSMLRLRRPGEHLLGYMLGADADHFGEPRQAAVDRRGAGIERAECGRVTLGGIQTARVRDDAACLTSRSKGSRA